MAALDAVTAIVPDRKVHAVRLLPRRYAACPSRRPRWRAIGDDRLATVSFFAAQMVPYT